MLPGTEVMIVNPHGRDSKGRFLKGKKYKRNPSHHAKKKHHAKKRHHNPAALAGFLSGGKKHHKRRYRRNPFGDTFAALVTPLAGGAAALGMDALIGYASQSRPDLQLKLQTGVARPAIEAASGIVLGMLVGTLFRQPKLGAYLAAGGLSVAGYNLLRLALIKMQPDAPLPLGEVEEYPALAYWNASQTLRGHASDEDYDYNPEGMSGQLSEGLEPGMSEFMSRDGGMGMFMRPGDGIGGQEDDAF